jgi:hypothetical protein
MQEYTRDVDERPPKPPLTDDPDFMASLADLDQGLIDDLPAAVDAPRQPPVRRSPRTQPQAGPSRISPEASAALAAAAAALAAFDTSPEAGEAVNASGPRAAVDLPPPPKSTTSRAPEPAQLAAPAVAAAVAAPDPPWRGRLRLIVLMIVLMLAGSAFVFRAALERALARWLN